MIPVESPAYDQFQWGPSPANLQQTPARIPVDFSPPLIVMLVVVATAFIIVTYFRLISRHLLPPVLRLLRRCRLRWRLWRHRRRSFDPSFSSSGGDIESSSPPSYDAFETGASAFYHLSPYGLDDAVIKTIPLSIYMRSSSSNGKKGAGGSSSPDSMLRDCAVCLLEFEDHEYVRTLPSCAHAFHVDCIDIWLRSHANCPLCRAGIFRPESPFIPLMAARIGPRLDHEAAVLIQSINLPEFRSDAGSRGSETPGGCEIGPAMDEPSPPPRMNNNEYCHREDHFNGRDFLLKRSYSFGFERSLAADRLMVTEPATASPWRYRRGSFWSKRTSPFSSVGKPRVFSFRSYRGGMKSPFFRRRGFFPLSESNGRYSGGGGGGGGSSRRSKSMTSPFFMRSSASVMFSSSRLRCGDPEALLSPERLNRR